MEAITLPEADADMSLHQDCMAALTQGGPFDAGRGILLPDLDPGRATLELPLLEPLDVLELEEVLELELEEAQQQPGAVLIYGWGAAAAAGLVRVLGEAGFPASVASTEQVLAADERAVVLAPLPSLEALRQQAGGAAAGGGQGAGAGRGEGAGAGSARLPGGAAGHGPDAARGEAAAAHGGREHRMPAQLLAAGEAPRLRAAS